MWDGNWRKKAVALKKTALSENQCGMEMKVDKRRKDKG